MTKPVFSLVLCAAIVLSLPRSSSASDDGLSGFTLKQLNAAIEISGIGSQRIESILTFRDLGDAAAHIAILSSSHSAWHLMVLCNIAGGLKVEWKSGELQDGCSVSSPGALDIDDFGG